jgi:hypothetical protein
LDTDLIENYYGANLPPDALEAFVARQVDSKNWHVTSEQYDKKWFGYRTQTPGQCLFRFAEHYRRALGSVRGRGTVSYGMVRFTQTNALMTLSRRFVTGFWTAMCIADEYGIPYELYCVEALKYGDRLGWKKLPSPTQIYGTNMVYAIKDAWEAKLRDGVMIQTDNPAFSVSEYTGDPWQDEYMKWLIDQALHRANPKFALVKCIFAKPQVTEAYAVERLGRERYEEIKIASL